MEVDSLVRMEWRPVGWSLGLPVIIFPGTIKSRGSLLAPAHPGGARKRALKRLWCGVLTINIRTDGCLGNLTVLLLIVICII